MSKQITLTANIVFVTEENLLVVHATEGIRTILLEHQLAMILQTLVQAKNQLISKQTFIDQVWAGNELVGQTALRKNIYKLRTLLRENGLKDQLEICTIPKKGYKLVVHKNRRSTKRKPFKPVYLLAAAAVLLLLLFFRPITIEEDIIVQGDPDTEWVVESESVDK